MGAAGTGKSTLAQNLTKRLRDAGYEVVESRHLPPGLHLIDRLSGIRDVVRLSHFFLRNHTRTNLLKSVARLYRTLAPAIARQVGPQHLSAGGILIVEPGWQMQLISHYLYLSKPLEKEAAELFVLATPPPDLAIYLHADPTVAMLRVRERARGVPKGLRTMDKTDVIAALKRGNSTARTLAQATESLGVPVFEIDTTHISAEDLAYNTTQLVIETIELSDAQKVIRQ
jgi:thymidylate kinase